MHRLPPHNESMSGTGSRYTSLDNRRRQELAKHGGRRRDHGDHGSSSGTSNDDIWDHDDYRNSGDSGGAQGPFYSSQQMPPTRFATDHDNKEDYQNEIQASSPENKHTEHVIGRRAVSPESTASYLDKSTLVANINRYRHSQLQFYNKADTDNDKDNSNATDEKSPFVEEKMQPTLMIIKKPLPPSGTFERNYSSKRRVSSNSSLGASRASTPTVTNAMGSSGAALFHNRFEQRSQRPSSYVTGTSNSICVSAGGTSATAMLGLSMNTTMSPTVALAVTRAEDSYEHPSSLTSFGHLYHSHNSIHINRSANTNTSSLTSPQSSLMDTVNISDNAHENDNDDYQNNSCRDQDNDMPRATFASTRGSSTATIRRDITSTRESSRKGQSTLRVHKPPCADNRIFNDNSSSRSNDIQNDGSNLKFHDSAYWNNRLGRQEFYCELYRPSQYELDEMMELEQWLGIPDASTNKSRNKSLLIHQWMQLNPTQGLAATQNSPMSIVLKRGLVGWGSHTECELILLTRGFVLARQIFHHTPRFQWGETWSNVEHVAAKGMASIEIACSNTKRLVFNCETASNQQAWMNAMRIIVLQAHSHQADAVREQRSGSGGRSKYNDTEGTSTSPTKTTDEEGWQYKRIQTLWFTEAVTGQIWLDSNMVDQMDNSTINKLDSYNQLAPLHYATRLHKVDSMLFLLQAGANPNLKDGSGRSSMDYGMLQIFAELCGRPCASPVRERNARKIDF